MDIQLLSIELTNRCDKGCGFCYNQSQANGDTLWQVDEVLALVEDCRQHGLRAVSFGGGEPLQYPGLHTLLIALQDKLFRSVTTNGLLLTDAAQFERLVVAKPDKVHISIHRPSSQQELTRVIGTVTQLQDAGIRSGVNLLVAADQLAAASQAAQQLWDSGIDNQRIVYLPQRGSNTPSPKQVAAVAKTPFQSMSCLPACGKSERFCAISWNKTVAWCSYTATRKTLESLSHAGIMATLDGLGLLNCASADRAAKPIAWLPTNKLANI